MQQKTQAEIEALKAKTQADIEATKAKSEADLTLKGEQKIHQQDIHTRTLEANEQLHDHKMQLCAHEKEQRTIEGENKQAAHEQSMTAASEAHGNSIDAERQKVGLPPSNAMDAIIEEMKADREANVQLFGVLSQGQDQMAEAIKVLAAVNSAPKIIKAPDGRVFTSEVMVN